MQMALKGWKYDKIIKYYYKGVRIVNIGEVTPAEQEISGDAENKDSTNVQSQNNN